jgi:hypothetical protein
MRILSYSRPQRATHFSEGTARVSRFGPPPEQREATLALLKTRNRLKQKQIPPDVVIKPKALILFRLFYKSLDDQTQCKRHGAIGYHGVSCFHHMRLIGPPRNPMESSMASVVDTPSHEMGCTTLRPAV